MQDRALAFSPFAKDSDARQTSRQGSNELLPRSRQRIAISLSRHLFSAFVRNHSRVDRRTGSRALLGGTRRVKPAHHGWASVIRVFARESTSAPATDRNRSRPSQRAYRRPPRPRASPIGPRLHHGQFHRTRLRRLHLELAQRGHRSRSARRLLRDSEFSAARGLQATAFKRCSSQRRGYSFP